MNPQQFGNDSAYIRVRIPINLEIWISNPGSLLVEVRRLSGSLRSLSSEHSLVVIPVAVAVVVLKYLFQDICK